jgi:hypothetical protein
MMMGEHGRAESDEHQSRALFTPSLWHLRIGTTCEEAG